jgi:hypothetical protein
MDLERLIKKMGNVYSSVLTGKFVGYYIIGLQSENYKLTMTNLTIKFIKDYYTKRKLNN